MTQRKPDPNGRALCGAHAHLRVDAEPPDDLESLPSMGSELAHRPFTCLACKGTGVEWPNAECGNCNGLGYVQAARERGN